MKRRKRTPATVRVWWHVDKAGPNDCWLWTGATNVRGYGHIGDTRSDGSRGTLYAHRVVWESVHGPVLPGMTIDHSCRVRRCCNPTHMAVMTQRENNLRGESTAAKNLRKTHCPAGHPYDEANTYHPPGAPTSRMCRACMYDREQRRGR